MFLSPTEALGDAYRVFVMDFCIISAGMTVCYFVFDFLIAEIF